MSSSDKLTEILKTFNEIKQKFDALDDYRERLDFWETCKFECLSIYINFLKADVDYWYDNISNLKSTGATHKSIIYKSDVNKIKFSEYITVVPQNGAELEELISWGQRKSIMNQIDGCNIDTIINEYQATASHIELHEEYIIREIEYNDKKIEKYECEYDNYEKRWIKNGVRTFFDAGYECILKAKKIDYDTLFTRTYCAKSKNSNSDLYGKPIEIGIHVLRGITYTKYKVFLSNELKRFESDSLHANNDGSHINQDSSCQQNKVKLQWEGEKDVLYDLFAQLLQTQNSKKDAYIIGNSIDSISSFISNSFEDFPSSETIARRIRAIKNDETQRPKRYRIDLQVHRSK